MRITETSSNLKANQTKKAKAANRAGNFSGLMEAESLDSASEVSSVANNSPITHLNAINPLSFVSEVSERESKRQNIEHGKDILKNLDMLRKAIILGALEYNTLHNISERLNIITVDPGDSELRSLIEEIRSRAVVEIEKLKKL